MEELNDGLYESLLTQRLQARLDTAIGRVPTFASSMPRSNRRSSPGTCVTPRLRTLSAQRDPAKRVELVNQLLAVLEQHDDAAVDDPRQLMSLDRRPAPASPRSRRCARRPRCPTPPC